MNTNGRMILNGEYSKKEHGALHYARNIQLSKDYKAIKNEDGFDELVRLVADTGNDYAILGKLVIDQDLIIFMNYTNSDDVTYFTIVEYKGVELEMNIILKTVAITVNSENYISADYTFNSKKERVITWSDGLTETSNRPFMLNIDNNTDYINASTGELIVDVYKLYKFTDVVPLTYNVDIIEGGHLKGGAYYVTTRVHYDNDIYTPWDVIHGPYYIGDQASLTHNDSLKISLSNVPLDAIAVECAFTYVSEGVVISKLKDKQYLYGTGTVDITLENNEGDDIDITEILVKSSNFSKVGTIAKCNNRQYLGGVEEDDSFINYQKYANQIKVHWAFETLEERSNGSNENSFQEGEVYAFDIAWLLKSGNLTPSYHIPGRVANSAAEKTYHKDPTITTAYVNPSNVRSTTEYPHEIIRNSNLVSNSDFSAANSMGIYIYVEDVIVAEITFPNGAVWDGSQVITIIDANYGCEFLDDYQFKVWKIVDTADIAEVTDYTLDVWANFGGGTAIVTAGFIIDGLDLQLANGYYRAFADIVLDETEGWQGEGAMGYWENDDEVYPVDDVIDYPAGKVRHHRFPFIREMIPHTADDIEDIDNINVDISNTRIKPIFENIIIPDEIKDLVKGAVISFKKKDNNSKTVYFSALQPVHYGQNSGKPNQQSLLCFPGQTRDGTNELVIYNYLKIINPDLLRLKADDMITHIIPAFKKYVSYVIKTPSNNNSNNGCFNGIGYSFLPNNLSLYTRFLYKDSSSNRVAANAFELYKNFYIQENSKRSVKGAEYDPIYNDGSDAFILAMIENNEDTVSDLNYMALSLFSSYANYDAGMGDSAFMISGTRHTNDVLDVDDSHNQYPSTLVSANGYIPYVYAYSKKRNVHFGVTANHDSVIAKSVAIDDEDLANGIIAVNNGDTKKGYYDCVQTKFPFPVGINVRQRKSYTDTTINTDNTTEDYAQVISEYNAGESSMLSWSKTPLCFSSITDPTKYYSNDEADILSPYDSWEVKVPLANPLANRTAYYDVDYNSLNIYGAPIFDTDYKNRNIDHYNAVVWSNAANDVKTNISNLSTYLAANRYYMPIEDGDIVNLVAKKDFLYIQQNDNLSIAKVKDVLSGTEGEVYTGTGDIFDRNPDIIYSNIGESIHCTHPLHCQMTMLGLAVIDNINKAIYTILGVQAEAISHVESDDFFKNNLPANYKNPFRGEGWQIATDSMKSVVYITSRDPDNLWTLSFNAVNKGWHSFHDYTDMFMIDAVNHFYSINKGFLYRHHGSSKGQYYREVALFAYRPSYPSYADFVISAERNIEKILESVIFETKYYDVTNKAYRNDKSITGIGVYTHTQACLTRDIKEYHGSNTNNWFNINKRNVGAIWVVNDFRDEVVDPTLPIIDDNHELVTDNIVSTKDWFNNNLISDNAYVVRLIMDNILSDNVEVITLSVYARKTNV